MLTSFPVAIAGERGCGDSRTPGGVYAESGLSPHGTPLEHFLIDPPLPVPDGLDIINKPMIWQPEEGGPAHLLIWIGEAYYPYVADYIEETRRMGASRKVSETLDFSQLTKASRLILVHPRALNTRWNQQAAPHCACPEPHTHAAHQAALTGPCLYKTYDLIPQEAAEETLVMEMGDARTCFRRIGGSVYTYHPSDEDASGLEAGIFAMLPLTGFALIEKEDGEVAEKAEAKLAAAGLNYYKTPD